MNLESLSYKELIELEKKIAKIKKKMKHCIKAILILI